MLYPIPTPAAPTVEPVAVLGGAGTVSVWLVSDAGQSFTLRMADASARALAAMLADVVPPCGGAAAMSAAA